MRRLVPLALVLAGSPVLAQDMGPPAAPAKHVNKVTDAAKAAFERMEKAMYSARAAGLKELSATAELRIEVAGGAGGPGGNMGALSSKFAVHFKAPASLKVEPKDGEGGGRMMAMTGRMKPMLEHVLRMSLGLLKPAEDEEFDADAKTVDGKTVVSLVSYSKGEETGRNSFTLDDRGLIESNTAAMKAPAGAPAGGRGGRMGGPPPGGEVKSTWTWRKEGDRWLVESMSTETPGGATQLFFEYSDAGGFKLVTGWSMGKEAAMSMGFKLTDVTVNGKKVEPAPVAKPESK